MADINTTQAGNLLDTATWDGGVVPGSGDTAHILHACTLTDGQTFDARATYFDLSASATLSQSGTSSMSGDVFTGGGAPNIACAGSLDIFGILRQITGSMAGVECSGVLTLHRGVTSVSYGNGVEVLSGGTLNITGGLVGTDDGTGWAIGLHDGATLSMTGVTCAMVLGWAMNLETLTSATTINLDGGEWMVYQTYGNFGSAVINNTNGRVYVADTSGPGYPQVVVGSGGLLIDFQRQPAADQVETGVPINADVGSYAGGGGTVPDPGDVRYGVAVAATTGTCHVPSAANVRYGVAVDTAGSGQIHVPAASNVRAGTAVDTTVGTCFVPTAANTLYGVSVDVAPTVGTYHAPGAADVRRGVPVGTTVGLAYIPALADVRLDVPCDGGTGTCLVPDAAHVAIGFHFDAGLTLVGTFVGVGSTVTVTDSASAAAALRVQLSGVINAKNQAIATMASVAAAGAGPTYSVSGRAGSESLDMNGYLEHLRAQIEGFTQTEIVLLENIQRLEPFQLTQRRHVGDSLIGPARGGGGW